MIKELEEVRLYVKHNLNTSQGLAEEAAKSALTKLDAVISRLNSTGLHMELVSKINEVAESEERALSGRFYVANALEVATAVINTIKGNNND